MWQAGALIEKKIMYLYSNQRDPLLDNNTYRSKLKQSNKTGKQLTGEPFYFILYLDQHHIRNPVIDV